MTDINKPIAKLKYKDQAKRDIEVAFRTFKQLVAQQDVYTYPNGARVDVCSLRGTIPVVYSGSQYNIPIAVYLLPEHPHKAPVVVVTPTETMNLRPTNYVTPQGLANIPYLQNWTHGVHDLHGLLSVLAMTFGEQCPVFAKTSGPGPANQAANQAANRPPNNPPPVNQPGPYPPMTGPRPYPPSGYNAYPPPSTYPPAMPMPMLPSGNNAYPPNQASYPANNYSGPYQYPGMGPPQQSYPYPNVASVGQPPAYGSLPETAVTASSTPSVSSSGGSGTLSENEVKMSLLSAIDDSVRKHCRDIDQQMDAVLQVVKTTQTDLTKNQSRLMDMKRRMDEERQEVSEQLVVLESRIETLKADAEKAKTGQSKLDIDDVVQLPAPVYRQLFDAWCEEQALEDALYCLSEALRKDVIDIENYLKLVRELSRRQFMQRLMALKCRLRAGLQV